MVIRLPRSESVVNVCFSQRAERLFSDLQHLRSYPTQLARVQVLSSHAPTELVLGDIFDATLF